MDKIIISSHYQETWNQRTWEHAQAAYLILGLIRDPQRLHRSGINSHNFEEFLRLCAPFLCFSPSLTKAIRQRWWQSKQQKDEQHDEQNDKQHEKATNKHISTEDKTQFKASLSQPQIFLQRDTHVQRALREVLEQDAQAADELINLSFSQLKICIHKHRENHHPIQDLATLANLNSAERAILNLARLMALEDDFDTLLIALRLECHGRSIRLLSQLLAIDEGQLNRAISARSRLFEFNLLHDCTSNDLDDRLHLSPWIRDILLREEASINELVESFLKPVGQSALRTSHFPHLDAPITQLTHLLSNATRIQEKGIHLMLYGPSGTGKTELAKLLAKDAGLNAFEVRAEFSNENDTTQAQRYGFLRLAQQFLATRKDVVIIFDEAEDAFPTRLSINGNHSYSFDSDENISKAWLNDFLENNPIPVIWISNSIRQIDPAYIRRFTFHLHMEIPPLIVRRQIAKEYLQPLGVSDAFIQKIANLTTIVPAQLQAAARFAQLACKPNDLSQETKDALSTNALSGSTYETLIWQQLQAANKAMGQHRPLTREPNTNYKLELLNLQGDVSPEKILQGLKKFGQASICLYGVSGTGKTEFAHHLAQSLGRELLTYSGSDLLSPWVGENEKNIRDMFEQAAQQADQVVILLDEADQLLQERSGSQRGWERSLVNEFLVRLEQFNGIFICATNLFKDLDQAFMRRFTFKLEFLALTCAQRELLLIEHFPYLNAQCNELAKNLSGLVPGDVFSIRKQLGLLCETLDANHLQNRLQKEISLRLGKNARSIGF